MKNLLEGSKLLDTDVTYKAKQQILAAPVIINMNGMSVTQIFKWCHEELPAFQSLANCIGNHQEKHWQANCIGTLSDNLGKRKTYFSDPDKRNYTAIPTTKIDHWYLIEIAALGHSIFDKATEKEKFEQQLSSIQALYQLTIDEKNGLVKEKEDLLKEYRELQQLIKRPLVNTTGQTTSYETKNKKPEEWKKALQQ